MTLHTLYNHEEDCVCVPSHSAMSDFATPRTVAPRLLSPWNSPGKNTGVACHFLLQGIFPTQGILIGRWILYHNATWEGPVEKLVRTKDSLLMAVFKILLASE